MKTLKMEVSMLPPEGYGKKIKIKREFSGHFPGLIWHIFVGTVLTTIHEWKVRSRWLLRKIRERVSLDRKVMASEIRIIALVFLNIIVITWIINQKFAIFSLSYSYASAETEETFNFPPVENPDLAGMVRLASEKIKNENNNDNEDQNKEEETKAIISELNKLIATQDEKCETDKKDERCTELCEENEKEIIEQMKAEERKAWLKYLSGKPKLLAPSIHISCSKDTKGARKSRQGKGKHMDEDCCPDPDEWPKPGCRYSAAGLELMMKGPKK